MVLTNNPTSINLSSSNQTVTINTSAVGVRGMKAPPQFDFEFRRSGMRQPRINVLVRKAQDAASMLQNEFNTISADDLIEVFGKYNPLYAGKPKSVPMALLNAVSMCARNHVNYFALMAAGMVYVVPPIEGVRKKRWRCTLASLHLLDHWAKEFPPFKPFVDAYVTAKARKEITVECFDLSIGITPVSFQIIFQKSKDNAPLIEAREKRRQAREDALKAKAQAESMARHMQAQQQYQGALNNTGMPIWTTQTYGTAQTTPSLFSRIRGFLG